MPIGGELSDEEQAIMFPETIFCDSRHPTALWISNESKNIGRAGGPCCYRGFTRDTEDPVCISIIVPKKSSGYDG